MHLNTYTCADLTCNRLNPSGQVAELSGLVTKILQVFENVAALSLKEKWTTIALQVSLYMYMYMHVYMLPWKACTHTYMYVHACTLYMFVLYTVVTYLYVCVVKHRVHSSCMWT